MARRLTTREIKRLSELLATQAVVFPRGVSAYYRDLVQRATLPDSWKRNLAGIWSGDADADARELIRIVEAKGVNPREPQWTTLGTLLRTILEDEDAGLDISSVLVAFIQICELTSEPAAYPRLRARYGIPVTATAQQGDGSDDGPDFDWHGPTESVELQSWIRPEPPLLDVGFLADAIRRAASVCRIELAASAARGDVRRATGVMIAPGMVLTNHHVMQWDRNENMADNARATTLRFGCFSLNGDETTGQTFTLSDVDPIAYANPALDFVLLRAEPRLAAAETVAISPLTRSGAQIRTGLNLLQHPRGDAMKLAISANGITGVFATEGFVQYVTSAAPGSSGAPCFDDTWNLVALHHAQRSRAFGRVGEGILASRILDNLAGLV